MENFRNYIQNKITFLLSIIPEHIKKKYHNLLQHMPTATRINFAQYWKKDTIPTISGWKLKLGECTAMATLTA